MEWKDIPGFEGIYQVSNTGLVKSLERYIDGGIIVGGLERKNIRGKRKIRERILSLALSNGYPQVILQFENKKRNVRIHRLVAENFIPNINKLKVINHKDGNRLNNNVNNLEWCTQHENIIHSCKYIKSQNGENNPRAKLIDKKVKDILFLLDNTKLSYTKISKIYNCSSTTVCNIKNKKSWKHICGRAVVVRPN